MKDNKLNEQAGKSNEIALSDYDNYLGLDWSQTNMAIARLTRKGSLPTLIDRDSDLGELKLYLRSLKGKSILTLEETTTAHWLYLELHDWVDRILICDPYRNRLLGEGPKTDKIDAGKLCQLLQAGLLKEVFHRDDQLWELRGLVSAYTDLVGVGVRCQNRRYALLQRLGGVPPQPGSPEGFILEGLEEQIQIYEQQKRDYEKEFARWCRRDPRLTRLLKVEGIGVIGAVKILAVVVDARRFPDTGHYLSYCGLVSLEKISGRRSYGRRKSRYSRLLKSVYKTAAQTALLAETPARAYYEDLLGQGLAEHNARHAVARYLAKVTYGMLKSGQPYHPYQRKEALAQKSS